MLSWQNNLIDYSLLWKGPKWDENGILIEDHQNEIAAESIKVSSKFEKDKSKFLDLNKCSRELIEIAW